MDIISFCCCWSSWSSGQGDRVVRGSTQLVRFQNAHRLATIHSFGGPNDRADSHQLWKLPTPSPLGSFWSYLPPTSGVTYDSPTTHCCGRLQYCVLFLGHSFVVFRTINNAHLLQASLLPESLGSLRYNITPIPSFGTVHVFPQCFVLPFLKHLANGFYIFDTACFLILHSERLKNRSHSCFKVISLTLPWCLTQRRQVSNNWCVHIVLFYPKTDLKGDSSASHMLPVPT